MIEVDHGQARVAGPDVPQHVIGECRVGKQHQVGLSTVHQISKEAASFLGSQKVREHPDIRSERGKTIPPPMLGRQAGDHRQHPALPGQGSKHIQIATIRSAWLKPGRQQQQALSRCLKASPRRQHGRRARLPAPVQPCANTALGQRPATDEEVAAARIFAKFDPRQGRSGQQEPDRLFQSSRPQGCRCSRQVQYRHPLYRQTVTVHSWAMKPAPAFQRLRLEKCGDSFEFLHAAIAGREDGQQRHGIGDGTSRKNLHHAVLPTENTLEISRVRLKLSMKADHCRSCSRSSSQ